MYINGIRHPMQPIGFDDFGVIRFKPNGIVQKLLGDSPYTLNRLASMAENGLVRAEDFTQLMQLIGYEVSAFCELPSSPRSLVEKAEAQAKALCEHWESVPEDTGDALEPGGEEGGLEP